MYAAGNDFIIVNSFDAAIELGDKRSAIYSSRSVSVIPERCTISIPLKTRIYDAPRIVSYIPSSTKKSNFPLTWTRQDGLEMGLRWYGLWKPLERTSKHVSKVFSFVKFTTLSTHPDRIHPENATPSTRRTGRNFQYIEAVSWPTLNLSR